MATNKRIQGSTPNGGASSEVFFSDVKGEPADETQATNVKIVEYDRDGEVINTTYGSTGKGGGR